MSKCFVPYCYSTWRSDKRKSKISFHKFPSDVALRKRWIVAIGKKDPKTGNYCIPHRNAEICSLHFSPAQFKKTKIAACLKQGSVPFIFPDHHLPQRGALIDEEELESIQIVPVIDPEDRSEVESKNSQSSNSYEISVVDKAPSDKININNTKRTFSEMNSSQISEPDNIKIINKKSRSSKSTFKSVINSITKIQKCSISLPDCNKKASDFVPTTVDLENTSGNFSSIRKKPTDTSLQTNSTLSTTNQDIPLNSNKNNCDLHKDAMINDSELTQDLNANTSITAVEQSSIQQIFGRLTNTDKSLLNKLNSEIIENHRLATELLKLQEENENLNYFNRIIDEKLKQFSIEELKKGIRNSNAKALFLKDQLCNLTTETATWSESTVEFANKLEDKLPASYIFLRQTGIINLPPPKKNLMSDHDYDHDVIFSETDE